MYFPHLQYLNYFADPHSDFLQDPKNCLMGISLIGISNQNSEKITNIRGVFVIIILLNSMFFFYYQYEVS